MTANAMEQKTAVFTPGDLRGENVSAGHQVDDSTRELPLIAGRFAGRQWIAEDLRREAAEKPQRVERPRRGRIAAVVLCGVTAFALLTGSLMEQAALAALNDQAVAASTQIQALREEQDDLRVDYARTLDLSETESYALETLGMQARRGDQVVYVESAAADRATVLGVRKGQGASYTWNLLVDRLGECFH